MVNTVKELEDLTWKLREEEECDWKESGSAREKEMLTPAFTSPSGSAEPRPRHEEFINRANWNGSASAS